MLGVGLRVSAQPTNAVVVRGALKVWLATLGASEDRVFAILLAVNEAFANAVEHPRDPISTTVEIAARYDEGMVEVTVRDYGGWKKESSDGHRSAGLLLMEAFTDSVTVHSDHRGTIVLLKERLTGPYEWASSAAEPAGRRTSTSTGPPRRRAARAESTVPTGPR
jgi:anti-sigma regulatory factor (Ser/Thr protein kinase)